MKLRLKLPLLIFLIMCVTVLTATAYFHTVLIPHYYENDAYIERLTGEKKAEITEPLRRLYPDIPGMVAYLRREVQSGKVTLARLQDDDRIDIYTYGDLRANEVAFHYDDKIVMEDGSVYELTLDDPLTLRDFSFDELRRKVYLTLAISLLAAVPLLALCFHLFVVRSLSDLQRLIERVSLHGLQRVEHRPVRRDEIGELQAGFIRMADRLRQAREEQVEMIAAITHDLRTPLTVIRGCNEKVRTQPDADRDEADRIMQRKIAEMSRLLEDFSVYSRNELEISLMPLVPVRVRSLFESVAHEYEDELEGLGARLVWSHRLPELAIPMNESMIRRVFANLIGNAVRYGGNEDLEVTLSAAVRGQNVVFTVGDNGQGLPEEEWTSIFKRFYRVEKSRQRAYGGTGLGLAICRMIAEQHGGAIAATRSPAGGLEVRFTLPIPGI